jgi:hypothetical protein
MHQLNEKISNQKEKRKKKKETNGDSVKDALEQGRLE